jgi:hypothetical protein
MKCVRKRLWIRILVSVLIQKQVNTPGVCTYSKTSEYIVDSNPGVCTYSKTSEYKSWPVLSLSGYIKNIFFLFLLDSKWFKKIWKLWKSIFRGGSLKRIILENRFLEVVLKWPLKITYFYNRWHCSGFSNRLWKPILTASKNLFCTSVSSIKTRINA